VLVREEGVRDFVTLKRNKMLVRGRKEGRVLDTRREEQDYW
jgi:hypothetical protein